MVSFFSALFVCLPIVIMSPSLFFVTWYRIQSADHRRNMSYQKWFVQAIAIRDGQWFVLLGLGSLTGQECFLFFNLFKLQAWFSYRQVEIIRSLQKDIIISSFYQIQVCLCYMVNIGRSTELTGDFIPSTGRISNRYFFLEYGNTIAWKKSVFVEKEKFKVPLLVDCDKLTVVVFE